jgi:rhodanese-related sulfurtransferase
VVSTFQSSTLKKNSACFLRGLVPAYETAFSHIPQIIKSTDVRNSDVAEVCGLRFAEVISAITEPMFLRLSTFLLQGNLNIILLRVVTDLVAVEQAMCINNL